MPNQSISSEGRIRTTVDIPRDLWERVRRAINNREVKSRNAFIVQALERYLEQLEEAWIDGEFARMKNDEEYKALNLQMAKEFAQSDWEAFQSNEKKS
jgi:metal-responsive CopG/Arc/MetJ family transcriptional regulator